MHVSANYRRLLSSLLIVTIAVSASLRFVRLGFGQGVLYARPDEELIRSAALIALTGDLNPHYAVWGHLFHYLYVAVGAAYLGLELCLGKAANWTDALAEAHCAPATFEILGRAISALAGTATVVVTYRLARYTLRSRLAAICSSIVLCTLFLHVRDSHFATSDVLLAFTSTAALAAMAGPAKGRVARAGLWTGLALATKLLAVTVVVSYVTTWILQRSRAFGRNGEPARWRSVATYLLIASLTALVLQPFLVLDPMETYFGIFGDLFNPERHPFQHGLNLRNASIVIRYYVPQAIGWPVGLVALAGAAHLGWWGRSGRRWLLIVYASWSLLAMLSVERIFLRYLDPLLPVASVFAGHAVYTVCRWLAVGKKRLAWSLMAAVVVASPNLARDLWLDHRLLQSDTRALAGHWIETHVPPGSRILWCGFGQTPPHLTMPRLFTPESHDWQLVELRSRRGLPTDVDRAVIRWKNAHDVPRYALVGLVIGPQPAREQSVFDAFPMVDRQYDIAWLKALDRWARGAGLLTRETPRVDLVQRHVTAVTGLDMRTLFERREPFLVITGMPPDPDILAAVAQQYEEVQIFSPGDMTSGVMYDWGDSWRLPNQGIQRVSRPGPEIRIFRLKTFSLASDAWATSL